MNNVIQGERRPPLDSLEPWADVLGLKGQERERFILAGQLAHSPEAVRKHLAKVEAELERLRRRS